MSMKRLADSKETSLEKGEAGFGLAPSLGCASFKDTQAPRMQHKEGDSSSPAQLTWRPSTFPLQTEKRRNHSLHLQTTAAS